MVISDSLTPAQTEPWQQNTRIISRANAQDQIAHLKRQSGKEIVVFGSRALWSDLLAYGLVDELHLVVAPVVVGGGTPLFTSALPLSPRLIETRTWPGSDTVLLRYDVMHRDI